MNRRRRTFLLLGLAILVGVLAASDISRREGELKRQLSPLVDVVVAGRALEKGRQVAAGDLLLRRIPARFAPMGAASDRTTLVGARLAVPVAQGGFVTPEHFARQDIEGAGTRKGERAVEVVALGSPDQVTPGARVDVLIAREREGAQAGARLAIEDVEVLSARPAKNTGSDDGLNRVAATLRVTLKQAVYLVAAQASNRQIRLLARSFQVGGRDE